MFSFFQTIFHKVTIAIASIAVAVGLISAPVPQTPVIVNPSDTPVINQQGAAKTTQQAQPTEKFKTNTKAVDNSAELEKARQEAEAQKIAREQAEAQLKAIQNQQAAAQAQTAVQAQAQQAALTEQQRINQEQETQRINALLKMYDDQIAERHRQTEIALQQLEANRKEKEQLIAPFQSELDALMAKSEKECSDLRSLQGGLLQQCNVWWGDAGILIAKISAITAKYSVGTSIVPTPNFNTQQSVFGQHYEIYYDGYGGGSIYNTSNPAESYKVYCAYGKCDMYGN